MGTTAMSDLPYPEPTDEPYVHLDLRRLAEATDEALPVVQAAEPPHREGRLWVQGERVWRSVNGAWELLGGPGEQATLSWHPNYKAQPLSPLRFRRVGRTVTVAGSFTNAQPIGNAAADLGYVVATLPERFRPSAGYVKLPLMIYQGSGVSRMGELRVNPDGSVLWTVYGYAQTVPAAVDAYDGSTTGVYEV